MDFPREENGKIPFFQLDKVLLLHLVVKHHIVGFSSVFRDFSGIFHIRITDFFSSGTQDLDIDVLEVFLRPAVRCR